MNSTNLLDYERNPTPHKELSVFAPFIKENQLPCSCLGPTTEKIEREKWPAPGVESNPRPFVY